MVYTHVGGHKPQKTLMETISEHPLIGSKVENGWKWKKKTHLPSFQNNHFESLWAMCSKKVWWDLHLISQQLPQALSNLIPKQPLDCSSPEGIGSLDSFFPGRGLGSKMVYTQVGGHNPLKTLMETISEHPLIGSKVENGWKWNKDKIIYHLSSVWFWDVFFGIILWEKNWTNIFEELHFWTLLRVSNP